MMVGPGERSVLTVIWISCPDSVLLGEELDPVTFFV